jgi:predicted TIM-barrel fold metal-dependent hydrolase
VSMKPNTTLLVLGLSLDSIRSTRMIKPVRVIDSHVHLWSNGDAPYPIDIKGIPTELLLQGQPEHLLMKMEAAGIEKAVVVQPINHKYDHSYLLHVLADDRYSKALAGVFLMNPTLSMGDGCAYIHQMHQNGFVGVRFNPSLWPGDDTMNGTRGQTFYEKCGDLELVVGFMCFKGLALHIDEIRHLLEAYPSTKCVIDHMGFFFQNNVSEESHWEALLSLSKYPQVHVKVSAFSRLSNQGFPYLDLDGRLISLRNAFSSNRLLYGSDFPFVESNQGGYERNLEAFTHWPQSQATLNAQDWGNLLGGTASRLYWKDRT